MILRKDQRPAQPSGYRILVRPLPAIEDSQLVVTPDDRKHLPNKGHLFMAGLNARDQMHDHGHELDDVIWWGRFAGVTEEWDHIEDETAKGKKCEHVWVRAPSGAENQKKWTCECGSVRLAEHLLVINVDDILANETLQRRIEDGKVSIARGKTSGGSTQHYIDRKDQ